MKLFIAACLASLFAIACQVTPAVNPNVTVSRSLATACEANCGELGMRLGSVVLIANSAGCVCMPADVPPGAAPASATATAAAAAVAGGAYVEAQQREQQSHSSNTHH